MFFVKWISVVVSIWHSSTHDKVPSLCIFACGVCIFVRLIISCENKDWVSITTNYSYRQRTNHYNHSGSLSMHWVEKQMQNRNQCSLIIIKITKWKMNKWILHIKMSSKRWMMQLHWKTNRRKLLWLCYWQELRINCMVQYGMLMNCFSQ